MYKSDINGALPFIKGTTKTPPLRMSRGDEIPLESETCPSPVVTYYENCTFYYGDANQTPMFIPYGTQEIIKKKIEYLQSKLKDTCCSYGKEEN